ncbi:hypothetical protein C8T65DRAFT_692086 [Cerioporus squamosus]|nr:hypothetical protein C8T65DRAFT_692086 [Cerioporus squamosus]
MPHTNDSESQSNADGSNDSRALKTKAIPPTFINLADCKPILSTTSTNTSTNSSGNGTTAFVFTSSRTLRALQGEEASSPNAGSIPSSPSTPSITVSDGSSHLARSRASLTLSQLVRHSDGAVDARSLLGPKMRAAGFVNLPNTLGLRSSLSCPSTPSSSAFTSVSVNALPTPSAPPDFPPIIFFNPSAVAMAPMWEYQREMQWSLTSIERQGAYSSNTSSCSSDSAGSSEFTPGPRQGFSFTPGPRPEYSPASSSSPPTVQATRRPVLEGTSSSSGSDSFGSSSTFASGVSTSTSLSSVEETDEEVVGRSGSSKGKARAIELEPTEYPFPFGRDSPRSHGSRGSRASSATASPTIIGVAHPATGSTSSLSTRPQITKSPSPRRRHRLSDESRDKAKTKPKDKETMATTVKPAHPPTPTFATAKRPGFARQYSLTELCESSPFVWLTNSEMFAPPAPISRSPVRTVASNLVCTPAASRPRPPVDPPHPPASTRRHRRHHTTADGRSHNSDPSGRVHRIPSDPIRMPTIPSEPGSSSDHESEKSRKLGRKAKECDAAPGGKAADKQAAPETTDPPGQSATADVGTGVVRERGRDPRGKVLGASETVEERAAAQADADMDREKAEALDGLAALALAHKEREFEFARNIVADRERTRVLKQKQRAHHKLRGKPLHEEPPSESDTTMVDQQASAVKLVS